MSAASKLGGGRAIVSGNVAFQLDVDGGDDLFQECTKHLAAESVDVMVIHGPPLCEALYGQPGKTFATCINDLVLRVRPKLFVCGHAHNPDNMKDDQKVAELVDGVLGINVACTGTWNQLYGMPHVVDLPVSGTDKQVNVTTPQPSGETLCTQGCWMS